jgi:glycosyltransferase involved in cell wall biosynthesis
VPYFSIITCTRNAAGTLEECIASIENQVCEDYEHLLIDGNSTDTTQDIVRAYQAKNPDRVRVHSLEPTGVTSAMNKGIDLSRGRVLLHLHADDRLAGPEVLGMVKRLFETTSANVVTGDCRLEGNPVLRHTWPENRFARALYKAVMPLLMFHVNPIAHPSTYVARDVFDRNGGFDGSYQVVMDYDFWFRILNKEQFFVTDKVLSIYRFHPDTISTRQMELGLREIDRIHAKYRTVHPIRHFLYASVLRPLLLAGKALRGARTPSRQSPAPETSQ